MAAAYPDVASHSPTTLHPPDASPSFMLGLPYVANGPLLRKAYELGAPVLISANALTRRPKAGASREWATFNVKPLALLEGMDASLDSAGFVATRRYGGYRWSVSQYLDVCEAFPWRWFAAMDFCVEPEIAHDRDAVLDRISMTVAGFNECLREARRRGIQDRLLPVIQGWQPDDYARCIDRMPDAVEGYPVIGVGSVCRRSLNGPNGLLAVIDRIDDELGDRPAKLHCFGVKSDGARVLRDHPRVASFDSQAYGVQARVAARGGGFSKSNEFLATVMASWYTKQAGVLVGARGRMNPRGLAFSFPPPVEADDMEARVAIAREEMRDLVERGEIDATSLHDATAFAWAFDE